jgi:hypothetical protein
MKTKPSAAGGCICNWTPESALIASPAHTRCLALV